MSHPQDLSLREQALAIAAGDLDAKELLDATQERIDERDGDLNSIVARFPEESEKMLASAPAGPLHGVPIGVKDMFALPWRAPRDGSRIDAIPAGESGVYRLLRDAGAVVVGVTNMHFWGGGATGHISAYGPVGNPWNVEHVGGGSSGGSAAAVGARIVAGAVGTDGGGSVRLPAAFCGITGLKTTNGSVNTDGYTHGYSSMGAIGPMCRDAADARLLGSVLLERELAAAETRRPDASASRATRSGPTSIPRPRPPTRAALEAAGWKTVDVEIEAAEHARRLHRPAPDARGPAERHRGGPRRRRAAHARADQVREAAPGRAADARRPRPRAAAQLERQGVRAHATCSPGRRFPARRRGSTTRRSSCRPGSSRPTRAPSAKPASAI